MLQPSTSVQYVKGIGPRLAELLAAKDIQTLDDLLHYLPFRYEDRLNPRGISELRAGEMATVIAEVRTSGLFRTRRMPIFQMTAGQGRTRLKCIWFNAAYLRDKFRPGQIVALYGKVEEDYCGGELQLTQPQFEIIGEADNASDSAEQKLAASLEIGRIVPIYESTGQGRLTSRWFRRVMQIAPGQQMGNGLRLDRRRQSVVLRAQGALDRFDEREFGKGSRHDKSFFLLGRRQSKRAAKLRRFPRYETGVIECKPASGHAQTAPRANGNSSLVEVLSARRGKPWGCPVTRNTAPRPRGGERIARSREASGAGNEASGRQSQE